MYKMKRFTSVLMLVMVFVMMFSSVALAAPMINLKVSDVSSLNIAKAQAEDTFVIKDNVIVGIVPAMVGLRDKILLPDTIDGIPVDVDYNKLAEYNITIESTRLRGAMDYMFREVKRVNNTAKSIMSVVAVVILILTLVLMSLSIRKQIYSYSWDGVDIAFVLACISTFLYLTFNNHIHAFILKLL